MKRLPIGRTIASIIAIVLFVFGGYLLFLCYKANQEFKQREKLRPVDMVVDFSKPGKFTGQFGQNDNVRCGSGRVRFFLEVPKSTFGNTFATGSIQPLQFDYKVTNDKGRVVRNDTFNENILRENFSEEQFLKLLNFKAEDITINGNYTITINVTQGVSELSGIPQRLFIAYKVHGCEKLLLGFGSLLMLVFLTTATVLLVIIGVITIVKKKRKTRLQAHLPDFHP